MRDGSDGTSGTPGNEESVTCRFIDRRGGSNPTRGGRVTSTAFWAARCGIIGAQGPTGNRPGPGAESENDADNIVGYRMRLKVCKAFIRELRLQLARTDKRRQEECDSNLGLIGENTLGADRSASPLRNFSCAPLLTANRGASIWFAT